MKKVLFLIPTLRAGGAERVLLNLLNQVDKSKFEIDLYIGSKTGVLIKDLPDKVSLIPIFPNYFIARLASFLYRKTGNLTLIKIFSSCIKDNYDVGISFLDGAFSEFLFHKNPSKILKKVVVIHSSYASFSNVSNSVHSPHYSRMKKRYSKVDTIIAVSHESMSEFKELFGEFNDMRVIYNPINTANIIRKAEELAGIKKSDKFSFIAIGSLVPVKAFDRLIDACALLAKDGYKFQLEILGIGFLQKKLATKISELRLKSFVHLLGFIKNPYPNLKMSDVFVMSSLSEGLPTVLCEAMVLDKPVLVPDVTGCREIVQNGVYGKMVKNSVIGIYEGMKSYLDNPENVSLYSLKSKERKMLFDDNHAIASYEKLLNGR